MEIWIIVRRKRVADFGVRLTRLSKKFFYSILNPRIIYFMNNISFFKLFYKNLSKKYYSIKIEVLTSNLLLFHSL